MPKSRAPGYGRPCLIVGGRGESAVGKVLTEAGFDVATVSGEIEATAALDQRPWSVVFASQGIGEGALRSLILHVGQTRSDLPVVVLGTAARLQDAVDAMQLGAADFVAPPFSPEVLLRRVKKLVADPSTTVGPATEEVRSLEHLGLTGKSATMGKICAGIARIARYKTNVLVLGESGSGKELIARALHTLGPRRNHLFVPINCATLGREILENELFGHERGAFTGANERKKGPFELADGGTLFLDEIGELDLSTQAKLLRVIERNEFRRVGGTGKVKVDLSLIAATNRNLEEAIVARRFREDLYYRLKVVTVEVPPLRDRREDIPALVDAFIADFNRRNDGKIRGITPEALRGLVEHSWPGNVRELKNAVDSAAIMTADDTIGVADFDTIHVKTHAIDGRTKGPTVRAFAPLFSPPGTDTIPISLQATLAEAERILIGAHLSRGKTKAEAARSLGIGLRTLYTKLGQLRHER